ncbi:MAG: flippase [Candidatus Omnitrophota bacterium]|jgi:PST family polysaccharide transporter
MRYWIRQFKKIYEMISPEHGKVVLNNFAFLSAIQAVTYIIPVIILPYLFRVIGPGKFGLIAFAQAFTQYFMIVTDYGFNISATREISICREDHCEISKVFSSVMTVKLALAFLSLLLLGIIVYFIPRFRNDWPVYILSFGAVIGNTLFPVWFFQGIEKMKHIAYLNIAGGFLTLFSIFIFVRRAEDYLWVPFLTSCIFLITGIWAQRIVFRRFGVSFKFPGYTSLRQQLKAGWDIFISNVAINAYTATRIFVVGLMTDNTITGFYAIAEKIANAFQTFPLVSFSQAIFPRLSKIFSEKKAHAFELMRRIQRLTVSISLIVLSLVFILAPLIVKVFCGSDYYSTVLSLRLLLIAVFFVSANAFRVQFLLVCGKTAVYSRIHIFMSMIGLPLIFFLVTSFGFTGAAVASIAIEAGIFSVTYFSVRRLKFS